MIFSAQSAPSKFFFFVFMLISIFFLPSKIFAATNLIPNGDLEIADAAGNPQDWGKGRWGTNTAVFEYPVSGLAGSAGAWTRAARVTISSYTTGDAKWYFKQVPITAGQTYEFKDMYVSSVPTVVTIQFQKSDGTFIYSDAAFPPAATTPAPVSFKFTAPAGVVSLSIFHLIKSVGTLTVDDYSLSPVEVPPPPPPPPSNGNLILNPEVETAGAPGLPADWFKGGYGNNTRVLSYPVSGRDGGKALRAEIVNYTDGDAKWLFKDVPVVSGNSYVFSDYYRSTAATNVSVRFTFSNGAQSYIGLGSVEPSAVWQQFSKAFVVPADVVSVTVFHAIKGTGFLETDSFSLTKPPVDPLRFNQGMVSITFDDGIKSTYENATPILDAAGFKGTFFLPSDRIIKEFTGYINTSQVLDLQNRGHEIGGHTRTHPNLTLLSTTTALSEIKGNRDDLLGMGVKTVDYFAYPYGAYNPTIEQMLKDAGFKGSRSSDGGYNFKDNDRYALSRQSTVKTTTFNEVKSYIDKAAEDKSWLILELHAVDSSGETYSVTPAFFQSVVDYLKVKGISVVTFAQGFSQF